MGQAYGYLLLPPGLSGRRGAVRKPVTALVVLYNSRDLLPELAGTLRELSNLCDVVIVDSASTDGSADMAESMVPWARTVRMESNRGFGAANNRGLALVKTPFVLLLNADAAVDSAELSGMLGFLQRRRDVAGVQPLLRLWEWPSAIAGSGASMTRYGEGYDLRYMHLERGIPNPAPLEVPGVCAAVSLYRLKSLREADGFDESIFMYFEDVDLSLRLGAAGWRFFVLPRYGALHRSGASSRREQARKWELESSIRLCRRFRGTRRGLLPGHWWRREVRTTLSHLIRGRSPGWRIRALYEQIRLPVFPTRLTPRQRALLSVRPMDHPWPRGDPPGPVDSGGNLLFGPGVAKTRKGLELRAPWCGFLPQVPGRLNVGFGKLREYATGTVCTDSEILRRFHLCPDAAASLSIDIPADCERFYLAFDRTGQLPAVGRMTVDYQTI
ncbi:glycosyltransferase [Candidatus Fermentibacteria bacterium]|nr:glycosyltransferase [Candidatus Fermentibacteria bacterium]